jgi:transcriptional regulator with XRE-family HTH domain
MSRPALDLLAEQLHAGKTITQVAAEIGYSRPAVSRYRNGSYAEAADKLEAAIVRAYDRRHCPHLNEPVEPALCAKKALAPRPFGGTTRLVWWKTCQSCPHKPEQPEVKP